MKHIPIMLALALSISLTSFDGSNASDSTNINTTKESSIMMNSIDVDTDDIKIEDGFSERNKDGI